MRLNRRKIRDLIISEIADYRPGVPASQGGGQLSSDMGAPGQVEMSEAAAEMFLSWSRSIASIFDPGAEDAYNLVTSLDKAIKASNEPNPDDEKIKDHLMDASYAGGMLLMPGMMQKVFELIKKAAKIGKKADEVVEEIVELTPQQKRLNDLEGWATEVDRMDDIDLDNYLQDLAEANPGFRVIQMDEMGRFSRRLQARLARKHRTIMDEETGKFLDVNYHKDIPFGPFKDYRVGGIYDDGLLAVQDKAGNYYKLSPQQSDMLLRMDFGDGTLDLIRKEAMRGSQGQRAIFRPMSQEDIRTEIMPRPDPADAKTDLFYTDDGTAISPRNRPRRIKESRFPKLINLFEFEVVESDKDIEKKIHNAALELLRDNPDFEYDDCYDEAAEHLGYQDWNKQQKAEYARKADAAYQAQKSQPAPPTDPRITARYAREDQAFADAMRTLEESADETESLSRGSLYRKRYYGRY